MDPALRLQPGQQELTPAQEAEARRFAAERVHRQLSTQPVDEDKAERLLRGAYRAIGRLSSPRIFWVDSPLRLQAVIPRSASWHTVFMYKLEAITEASIWKSLGRGALPTRFRAIEQEPLWWSLISPIRPSVMFPHIAPSVESAVSPSQRAMVRAGTSAYTAGRLTLYSFFATYLAPNEAQSLARFNELVSGYWLGQEVALVVRRPKTLSLDEAERLHSATGPGIAYPDGWGFYAWHGVRVPQKLILAPEQLTFQDWRDAENMEVRRVIQERLGEQFMTQVGGVVMDTGPRGTLYEVPLPGGRESAWERVAHYVQVQDTSTERRYFLRVPPTIQTAAEAVAWSFGLSVEDYHPALQT